MAPRPAVAHLAGLQAQAPLAPYVGLQARLAGFRPDQLKNLLTERSVLRAHLWRNTIHLVTAADFTAFRPLTQPVTRRALAGNFGRRLTGVDLPALTEAAAALLSTDALTRTELGRRLAPRWPGHDPGALAHAATHSLILVQVPPRGLWGETGPSAFMLASAWLAGPAQPPAPAEPPTPAEPPAPPDPARAVEQLVLRYLAAYGPATVADVQAWSGLSRLREVTERLNLRAFPGPDGARLLDLPDAPHPDPGTPAPPRFLPEYDNLLLSFAERSRVIPHGRPVPLPPGNGAARGTLLVDGFWQADWAITRAGERAVLEVRPFVRLSTADRDAIAAEGELLLGFAAESMTPDIRFAPVS